MHVVFACCLCLLQATLASAAPERGTVRFEPAGDQKNIPERYRLDTHRFDYEMELKSEKKELGISVHHLRFPSPIESAHKENNTVHAEYYRPRGNGPFPATIVLDITGGDQSLSRGIATHLAQKGIASLFVQMAYYGPRRPPGTRLRLMSYDLHHSFNAIRQTVLDVRRATAWLESRSEVDRQRLGIVGTSLGSMVGALAAEMEPRLGRVTVLLGGGGLVDGFYDHPEAAPYVKVFEKLGGTRAQAKALFAPIDPLTCAANLKDRKVLIMAAKKDEIVPPRMSEALWEASGRQKLVWFNCGHYSAILYLAPALEQISRHLTE